MTINPFTLSAGCTLTAANFYCDPGLAADANGDPDPMNPSPLCKSFDKASFDVNTGDMVLTSDSSGNPTPGVWFERFSL